MQSQSLPPPTRTGVFLQLLLQLVCWKSTLFLLVLGRRSTFGCLPGLAQKLLGGKLKRTMPHNIPSMSSDFQHYSFRMPNIGFQNLPLNIYIVVFGTAIFVFILSLLFCCYLIRSVQFV
ncbi:putative RING finger protein [Naja naja]|nr:putative RING finger protein [Naja naja]